MRTCIKEIFFAVKQGYAWLHRTVKSIDPKIGISHDSTTARATRLAGRPLASCEQFAHAAKRPERRIGDVADDPIEKDPAARSLRGQLPIHKRKRAAAAPTPASRDSGRILVDGRRARDENPRSSNGGLILPPNLLVGFPSIGSGSVEGEENETGVQIATVLSATSCPFPVLFGKADPSRFRQEPKTIYVVEYQLQNFGDRGACKYPGQL